MKTPKYECEFCEDERIVFVDEDDGEGRVMRGVRAVHCPHCAIENNEELND